MFILAGLLLIALAGEVYFRFTVPFSDSPAVSDRLLPGVIRLQKPNEELRFTNDLDYWTVQRTNSLGFLDREPIDPLRSAESCHISIIGDSFVEAREVPVSDKLQVRLESLAARDAPHLDVTTSAFGLIATSQVHQLLFYDGYARHLSPDLLVLVFVNNDPLDNSTVSISLLRNTDPVSSPRARVVMSSDGAMDLRMPNADTLKHLLPPTPEPPPSWPARVMKQAAEISRLARWLQLKSPWLYATPNTDRELAARSRELMRRQEHAWMFDGWIPSSSAEIYDLILDRGSTVYREAWGITEFALEQFKRRANHDGTALMILATYTVGGTGDPAFDVLSGIAESLDIPLVSEQNYIDRQGYSVSEAHFPNDGHWTPTGHRWAAEAVWEYIEEEWNEECPSAVRDPDMEVDWIKVGHQVHTPEGKVWSDVFPKDLNLYREAYASVATDPPTVSSDWNVHLYDDGVTYIRDRCTAEDVENHFFLHVIPEDVQDLPEVRRDSGFESITFNVPSRGAMFDGKCLVSVDLPDYDISSISTGQFGDDVQIWKIDYNLAFPEIVDAVHEVRRSGREPVILANFDVYIDDGQLIYAKDSCNADDRELPFFLHLFPADENDLPDSRQEFGFDNLDFESMQRGGESNGVCFAAVALPEYDIASIRTGQVAGDAETWSAYYNFELPDVIDAVQELLQSGREPEIRSNFDVFMNDDQLVYVKESCNVDDRDLPFFLHVFPADENDLAEGREESGFDNLDFELWQNGGESDGLCFAVVALPSYDIAGIRTGQWVRGEDNVWEASIEFGE